MKNLPILCLAIVLSLFSQKTFAAEAYLSKIPDVPLMSGMTLENASDVSSFEFDKAEGRIIDETAKASGLTQQDVAKFYQNSLPPLGWTLKKTDAQTQRFVRNGEQLIVKWEQIKGGEKRVRFGLSPEQK